MRLTVFGATGRVGHTLVHEALEQGHDVTAYVRDPARLKHKHGRLFVRKGSLEDAAAVADAVRGTEVVVSTLGARDVTHSVTVVTQATRTISAAMKAEGVQRLVVVGAAGLLPHPAGGLTGEHGLPPFLRHAFEDHRNAFQVLQESGLDWVVVCPPVMPSGVHTGKYRTAVEALPTGGRQVYAEDVADFTLTVATRDEHHRVRIGIVGD
ncbi:MAG TPA: NAD(P)H-binding protein [Archangium sp.]|jgi:putative NADH-flavin reductase|uniref:NAD(P)-dependent oxidoreductase n=1 Tax=Archangium sp. TaxID=1872627 RepID=UPI002ED77887